MIERSDVHWKSSMSPSDNNHRLFCFGFGYVASALARALIPDGWQCAGTSRGGTASRQLEDLDSAGLASWGVGSKGLIVAFLAAWRYYGSESALTIKSVQSTLPITLPDLDPAGMMH